MIPTTATHAEFVLMVERTLDVYRSATPEQIAKGRAWYPVAHDLAAMIGDGDVRKGAGVIAALSANKSWSENMRLATRVAGGTYSGHFADALRKARAIMEGTDPETVLPMHKKTGNFFLCILDPTDPMPVCIDRHAHDIAAGARYGSRNRGLSSVARYDLLSRVYGTGAMYAGEVPSAYQAITWVTWLDRNAARV